ncbi:MAG: PKD domain-containing protein, partial [Planctomycetes bacterium]|nr:PKD domain-containing protein [Planctomycetota bacterium]
EDRPYTGSGFTGGPAAFLPIRQAEIELLRSGDDALLASGFTTNTGSFSLTYIGPNQIVRVRVYARRQSGQIHAVVLDNAQPAQLYSAASPTIDTNFTTSFGTIDFTIAGGGAPAFNIFDCAVKNFQYLASAPLLPTLADTPPLLEIHWDPGGLKGTYFDNTVPAVFLLGKTSDPDQYDDDIILHEIGHWVAFTFSKDDTIGGGHSVIDQLDPRVSWSEGWAHYWSASVRRFCNAAFPPAEYAAPNLQVDNFFGSNSVFDLEGPSFPTLAIMATNELAVAASLWDITDPTNEAFDTLSGNEAEVWRSVNVRIPARTNITLEDFTAGLALEAPGIMAAVTGSELNPGIYKDRKIRYYPDSSEPNNVPAGGPTLALGATGLTLRTFTDAVDEDWFSVDATPGTLILETLNLGDGADTRLELYDAAGLTLLASNDDRSPGDRSSQITRLISLPTTFGVRVQRSGAVVERGYYDLRAQILPNGPPAITALTASALSGTAPLRVTFSATISDPDASAHEYQWDFDGDGVVDWTSLEGPDVTTTYDEPGVFSARLRVVDSGDFVVQSTVTITVSPSNPALIVFGAAPPGGTAPLPASFSATATGVTPVAYLWDFDGDGIFDSASVTTATASFTYRGTGTFSPRLVVRDASGRATRALAPPITVSPGASPPLAGTFTATGGTVPFDSTFTAAHSDLGLTGTVEFDVDGDGRFDLLVPPGSPTGTTIVTRITRAGALAPRVRITDSAGSSATAAASMTAVSSGVTGWMVDPLAGDRLSGSSVTLTAQAVPGGLSKAVRFQVRDSAGPGPWTDVGAAIASTGTLFSATWNVSALPALSTFDVRILIDGTVSSGDTAATVVIDSTAPTIDESGSTRTKSIRTDRTTLSRNAQGVWAIVPLGSTSDALPLSLQPATAPSASGSAAGLPPAGTAWTVGFAGTFGSPFRLRLPFSGNGAALEIHHFDAGSSTWQRLARSRVSHDDGWVEADVNASGIYSLFGPTGGGGGRGSGGGGCGLTGVEVLLLLGLLRSTRRRLE